LAVKECGSVILILSIFGWKDKGMERMRAGKWASVSNYSAKTE